MRIVINSVLLVLVIGLLSLIFVRRPLVMAYRDCYALQKDAVTERELLMRRTYKSEADVCEEKKKKILDAYECFTVEERSEVSGLEMGLIETIAKALTQTSRSIDEVIVDYNRICTPEGVSITDYELEKISFDTRSY